MREFDRELPQTVYTATKLILKPTQNLLLNVPCMKSDFLLGRRGTWV